MKRNTIRLLAIICAIALALTIPMSIMAEVENDAGDWKPTDSVNMIVAYAPGGPADILARTIAQYIDLDGQTMYVTNIEGAGGTIGGMEAYHSSNDGLTLFQQSIEACAGGYVGGTLEADLCNEMVWVACLVNDPSVICVAPDSPYNTLEDVLTAAEENPGDISLAGIGGASTKGAVEDIEGQAGVDFTFVPYDSDAKSRSAVMGGHEDLLFCQLGAVRTYADSGELRILAVASEDRVDLAPDVPTFLECGIDSTYASTRCVMLPPETDEKIARYYEAKLQELFGDEEFLNTVQETLGFNTEFVGMDDLRNKIDELTAWAEEYVPAGMNQ